MKKGYRKVIGFLLLGVTCLVAGCQSLLPPGFKKSTFRTDCEWLEVPYHFRCDYYITHEVLEPVKPDDQSSDFTREVEPSLPREGI